MSNNEQMKKEIMELLEKQTKNGGISASDINIDRFTSKMSDEEKKRLNELLTDPQKQQEMLNSTLAQKLIKKFGGK